MQVGENNDDGFCTYEKYSICSCPLLQDFDQGYLKLNSHQQLTALYQVQNLRHIHSRSTECSAHVYHTWQISQLHLLSSISVPILPITSGSP